MKLASAIATTALGLAAALPAAASTYGFTGAWSPATWTTTIVGNVAGGDNGNVNTSAAPGSISITDGNDPTNSAGCQQGFLACEIRYGHALSEVPIQFNWAYTSTDSAAAQLDQFGVIVDNVYIDLSDPGGAAVQSGFASFTPVSSFAFFFNCGDCAFGDATATISNFQAPEPTSWALVGAGIAGLALRRKARP